MIASIQFINRLGQPYRRRKGMRRFLVSFAAFGVVAAMGASASAAELKASGQMKIKHIMTNETAGYQAVPRKDMPRLRVDYARANMYLQFLANQYMGFVWGTEIDFHFGDGAYTSNRSMGGGLAADTTNLENKQIYMHFDIPNTPLSFRGGITGVIDSYGGTFHNTDTAGLRLLADMGAVRINVDWFRWWNTYDNSIVDDVDIYELTGSVKLPAVQGLVGGSFYYLKDGSSDPGGNRRSVGGGKGILNGNGGTLTSTDVYNAATKGRSNGFLLQNSATGNAPLIPQGQAYHLDSYYLGAFGNVTVGPVKIEGWGLYNFGTIDYLGTPINANFGDEADISAIMLDLMVSMKMGIVSASLEGMWVSGQKDQTNTDFGFVTGNAYQLAGAFYYRHGMMIILPDGDDIDNSSALVYDVANVQENQYLGMIFLGGNASVALPAGLGARMGAGAVWSSEKRKVNDESFMGFEINGSLSYTITQATTITLNAAYAWTGDYYKVEQADLNAFTTKVGGTPGLNTDPDDLWYTALRFMVVF
jgi:hypothetical protein